MTELAVRNVKQRSAVDLWPIGFTRQKNKLRFRIDEVLDQPRAGYAIDFHPFARDPFHKSQTANAK